MLLNRLKIVLCIVILLTIVSNICYAETETEILDGYQSYRLYSFSESDYQSFKNNAHVCEYLEEGNTSDCITVSGGQLNIASVNSGYCGVKFSTSGDRDWMVRFDMTLGEGNACFSVYDGETGIATTVNESWLMVSEQTDGTGICRKNRTITTETGRTYTYIIKAIDGAVSIYRRPSGSLRYQTLLTNLKMLSSGEEHCVNIYSDFVASQFSIDNLELFGTSSNSATVSDQKFDSDGDSMRFDMSVISNSDGNAYIAFYMDNELRWCKVEPITTGKNIVSFENIPSELKENCTHFSVYIWNDENKPCYDKQSFMLGKERE